MALRHHLKRVVCGRNDGIVTTLALVAGFEGAGSADASPPAVGVVLPFGLAGPFGAATPMGLGDRVSERSEREVEEAEREAVRALARTSPDEAAAAAERRLVAGGLAAEAARGVTDHLRAAPTVLADAALAFDRGMSLDRERGMVVPHRSPPARSSPSVSCRLCPTRCPRSTSSPALGPSSPS